LPFELTTVATREELAAAIAASPSVVIADLPLPWKGADEELSELQRTRQDVPVIFRWGAAGSWSVEDASAQIGRMVRGALALGFDREQSPAERRRVLQEVVRYQDANLRLGQIDTWDWEQALNRATEIMAETADVERVGVWSLIADRQSLECETLYLRSRRTNLKGGELNVDPAYRRAIERATFVAANDAQHDPRTSAFATEYLGPLGITSMLDAPIRRGGVVTGVVCLEHVGAPRQWNVVEQCAASAFAGVVARILEVRERRLLEEQWQESRRLEVIGRMAGAIAHDFSNIATVITGFSETLLSESDDHDPRRPALLAIQEAGRSATSLVRQLLDYTTQRATQARTIDLCDTIRSARPIVQRLLGPGIALQVNLPETPLWVLMDPSQVHRIVLNLAANSRDALPRGGTFTLDLDLVDAQAEIPRPGAVVRLRATDNGQGIPGAILPHIFEPLYTTKPSGAGTGLGLSAVRAIVTSAGGSVSVESRPGTTTCFTILLPQAEAPAVQSSDKPAGAATTQAQVGTILVVDDEPMVGSLLKTVLERRHYTAVTVTSPHAALEQARAIGANLAMVISDFTMREMSGVELVHALRELRPGLPALILTGQPHHADLLEMATAPRTRVVPKPFEIASLVEEVGEMVRSGTTQNA
jgi:signal transduction histidine kinase/CheY-like chemotaxis protein